MLSIQYCLFGRIRILNSIYQNYHQQQLCQRSTRAARVLSRLKKDKEKLSSSIDDEPYHDRDFDFNHSLNNKNNSNRTISLKELFKQDRLNLVKEKERRNLKKFVNALYDDNEDVRDHGGRDEKFNRKLLNNRNKKKKIFDNNDEESETKKNKKGKIIQPLPYDVTEENRFEILNQIVIPLYKVPYQQQLKRKFFKNKDILRSLGSKLRQLNSPLRIGPNDLPCPLEPIRPSPQTERYRNKDEFSIWPGIDGNPKTVGFFIGQPSIHDRVICVEPDHIVITKQSHLDLCRKFQKYLRDISPYEVCQNYGEGGNWRRVHIRSNQNGQHMLTAIMHPQDLTQEQLQEEMDRLKEYFSDDPSIFSLYFHASRHTRSTHTGEPYYHLYGDRTITENLFDKKFVISPSSFFQINTQAAEILYRVIMTEMNVNSKTTVLDLCCGTGTLSILLSKQVRKILAIDSSESAIEDARKNAELNDIKNIEFFVGTVEEILPKLFENNYLKEPIVAVANPSRRALHPYVIDILKKTPFIKRLVYVSCKPEGDALRNFVQLCQPLKKTAVVGSNNSYGAEPFIPINAVPVDMFPHTEHCELVLTFERY